MIVTLQTERVQTLADVGAVIDGNDRLDCTRHGPMNTCTLWNHIEARLDSQLPN